MNPVLRTLMTGLGLAVIAVWICLRMQPAVALWREMLAMPRPEGPGLAWGPVAAVVAVSVLQAMSAGAILLGSVAGLALLIVRSRSFAKVFLAGALIQGAFVFAGAAGTSVAERAALSVSVAIHGTRTREPMIERFAVEQVQRYRDVTAATTTTLVWTWAANALLTSLAFTDRWSSFAIARPAP